MKCLSVVKKCILEEGSEKIENVSKLKTTLNHDFYLFFFKKVTLYIEKIRLVTFRSSKYPFFVLIKELRLFSSNKKDKIQFCHFLTFFNISFS